MKTLKNLTPEIRAKIPLYKERCTKNLYSGKEHLTNRVKDTVEYIHTIYSIAGYKPPRVIVAKNPIEYKLIFNSLFKKTLDSELDKELGTELDSELYKELSTELYSELDSELGTELSTELPHFTTKSHYLLFCNIYSRVYLTWYYFIHKELKVKCSKGEILEKLYFLINKTFITRCFFTDKTVLVLKTPSKILRNDLGFHSVKEAAIQFQGGYGMYYINGRRIRKSLFYSLYNNTYTLEEWLQEPDEENKSVVTSFIRESRGEEALVEFLQLTKVNTYVHKPMFPEGTKYKVSKNIGVYTLMKGNNKAFVRVFCHSTDRMFHLEVENKYICVKEAIASLFKIPTKLISHLLYFNRQGERYSPVFDSKGRELVLKNKENKSFFQDTQSLTGDKYFSLVRYEY